MGIKPGALARSLVAPGYVNTPGGFDRASPAQLHGAGGSREPLPPTGDLAAAREQLARAISAVHEEEARYDGLANAQHRAAAERLDAQTALAGAETTLRDLTRTEPSRLAYAFANNEALRVGVDIGAAKAEVEHCRTTLDHVQEIEAALATEIADSERRRTTAARALQQAKGAFLVASPAYAELYAQHGQALARLRTIRAVLNLIDHEGIPAPFFGRWRAEEPLEIGYSFHDGEKLVSYEYDRKLLDDWRRALDELQQTANTPLPGDG